MSICLAIRVVVILCISSYTLLLRLEISVHDDDLYSYWAILQRFGSQRYVSNDSSNNMDGDNGNNYFNLVSSIILVVTKALRFPNVTYLLATVLSYR